MMFNVGQSFIDMIRSIYPNLKVASGGREIVIRCPFCGDSKNLRHSHFYISVPQTQDELSLYHCKLCPNHGIVDDDLLRKIGCADSNILIDVMKHNSEVLSLPKYRSLKRINIYPLKWDLIRQEDTNQDKLNYINSRIGSNFNFGDLVRLKIFLNLYDIININKLELTRHQNICNDLDKHFIGFISYDNSYCNLRKVTTNELYPSINKRYIIYNLINKFNDAKNFYVIPSKVDILNPSPVKIHIAEGPFDILSIFYNLNNQNDYQNIYIACGGKSYIQALEFILNETGLINYEIHYYPDKDVTDNDVYYNIIRKINILPCDIYIHRNSFNGEKDFGVPRNRIVDTSTVIREANVY